MFLNISPRPKDEFALFNSRGPVENLVELQAAPTVRVKNTDAPEGADCLVVGTKWGNAHRAKHASADPLPAAALRSAPRSFTAPTSASSRRARGA